MIVPIGGGAGGAGGLKPFQLCKSGKKGGLSLPAFATKGEGDYTLNIYTSSIYRILKIPYHCWVTFVRKNRSTRFYTVGTSKIFPQNAGNAISKTLDFKILRGSMPPTSSRSFLCLRCSKFSPPPNQTYLPPPMIVPTHDIFISFQLLYQLESS